MVMKMDDQYVYVVDYDIPKSPRLRSRFYRAINRYLTDVKHNGYTKYSTQSVIITNDPNFADYVFNMAINVGGRARLYLAKQIRSWQNIEDVENALKMHVKNVVPITRFL